MKGRSIELIEAVTGTKRAIRSQEASVLADMEAHEVEQYIPTRCETNSLGLEYHEAATFLSPHSTKLFVMAQR